MRFQLSSIKSYSCRTLELVAAKAFCSEDPLERHKDKIAKRLQMPRFTSDKDAIAFMKANGFEANSIPLESSEIRI